MSVFIFPITIYLGEYPLKEMVKAAIQQSFNCESGILPLHPTLLKYTKSYKVQFKVNALAAKLQNGGL